MDVERNLGEQPLREVLERHELSTHDLVAASTEQLTHKTVTRAIKGRRLTPNSMGKVQRALNAACGGDYARDQLFNYASGKS